MDIPCGGIGAVEDGHADDRIRNRNVIGADVEEGEDEGGSRERVEAERARVAELAPRRVRPLRHGVRVDRALLVVTVHYWMVWVR